MYCKIFFLILFFTVFCNADSTESDKFSSDEKVLHKLITDKYIKAIEIRDFSLILKICYHDANLMGVRSSGEINVTTLEKWAEKFDPKKSPFKKLESYILRIDCTRNAAQAKIQFLINDNVEVIDYLNLLKINNQWKIVNIIDS